MSKLKEIPIEKNGVRAVATAVTLRGLTKRGWTVVDDENKEENLDVEADVEATEQPVEENV